MTVSLASPHTEITEREKAALLTLLADDDPEVFEPVRARILSSGPGAIEWLKAHALSQDPVLRRRSQAIVRQFERHAADNDFVVFCLSGGQDMDLEKAVLLLSRTAYPDISMEGCGALLDHFAAELAPRLKPAMPANDVLTRFRSYLHQELGFVGNDDDYYDPDNSYFSRVLDRRTGNPISLCALYILIAKRLRLPIAGIGMPGHFLCRYQTSAVEVYLDAFKGGKLMTKADCLLYLTGAGYGMKEDFLSPVSPRKMLLRMCGNLNQIYARQSNSAEDMRLRRYMVALSK
jgi:regulator of sirC expression with transglutaminase-like and TPR domain